MADSTDVAELLAQFVQRRKWWAHYYGGRKSPRLIAYTYVWQSDGYADVLILRGEDQASAYRTYWKNNTTNILNPDLVFWYYESTAYLAIRAMLRLPAPNNRDAPFRLHGTPQSCRVDDAERPVVIRPTRIAL